MIVRYYYQVDSCVLISCIYTFELKDMNFTVLCARCLGHQMNNLMYLMKSGTACY
jgi:hypothetical protein